ncbi:sugar transferase [Planococcus sp. YIM B11945]|uniref:sugar transferase n=1 Tax=Planococcus sp. YIM B11945 TaxID=3435410 RepID=UPI003D7CA8A1
MYEVLKRLFDVIVSLGVLILLSPLWAAIAVIIKTDSEGPVLFKQKRVGKDNALFQIYKFRTMVVHTPDVATDKLENPKDYITKSGHWLRKTSLDELPQLINILGGEMSFVGPRPALYNQYELIRMREEMGIHKLVPGLTGYAQVKGRDLISDFEKVSHDGYYARNKCFQLDMAVLFWTVRCVVKAEGIRMDF